MAGNSIVFMDNLDEVLSALNSAIESGLVKIRAAAQGYAKDNTPVRTGTLHDSIGVEVKSDEKDAYIGTIADRFPTTPHGQYVDFCTRRRPCVHMLLRAATEHADEYKRVMEDSLKNA